MQGNDRHCGSNLQKLTPYVGAIILIVEIIGLHCRLLLLFASDPTANKGKEEDYNPFVICLSPSAPRNVCFCSAEI